MSYKHPKILHATIYTSDGRKISVEHEIDREIFLYYTDTEEAVETHIYNETAKKAIDSAAEDHYSGWGDWEYERMKDDLLNS